MLRWPDTTQAQCMVLGFPIVGQVPPSGVFRTVPEQSAEVEHLRDWLTRDAGDAVESVLRSPPPCHWQDIERLTRREMEKGFCSSFLSRRQAIWRFLAVQPDGSKG